jgi:nitrite reductase/ring-hydroxylating ferredoxin subunit
MPQRHPVTTLEDLPPGTKRAFDIGGRRIALCNVAGNLHAIDDICPHAGASMSSGPLQGTTLICPLHGFAFNVTNGVAICPKSIDPLQTFPTFINGNQIEVEI